MPTLKMLKPAAPLSNEVEFWRLPKVRDYSKISRSTILRGIERGEFPRPVKLGPNCVAWIALEVQEWAAERIAARDQVAA